MTNRLGNFELLQELGCGAWGRVYAARQVTLGDRLVAVKVLLPHLASDPRARQRFLDEAQNMARLSHPNIVQVIEVGEQEGTYYFAMGYVEGQTLADLLARQRLTCEQAAAIGAQIAEALGHAHNRGVIHRDIKPGNIMMDSQGRPVITDFGIAKVGEGSGLTMTGGTIGTPEFMSPEQAQGNPVDGRSDLYSLGIMLYYMTTGYVPFTGATPVSVGLKHVGETPRDPREIVPNYPPWLAQIIMRSLAKQPCDRFACGEEMAAALHAGSATATATPVPGAPAAVPTAPPPPAPAAAPAPARVPVAPTARRSAPRPAKTALISVLLVAIFFVAGMLGTMAFVRMKQSRAAPPGGAATTPAVLPAGGGGGGVGPGGGLSGAGGEQEVIAVVRQLHEAISKHDTAAAVALFAPATDGTPPYGLDQSDSYAGIESSAAGNFRNFGRSGDEATIECDVTTQMADAYVVTPFAYRLQRQESGWLISDASRLTEGQRRPGRAPGAE